MDAQELGHTALAEPVEALTGARVGKLVAVHVNYISRAQQRGRAPTMPSYFHKPTSSLTLGRSTVARPAGTELLTFEGEIAVVIARTARHVSAADAWAHVAAVTAANDLGVADLRTLDKGSNVRSKGGDGFTPIGPELLPIDGTAPPRLRVRTWLDDELVQNDSTDGMLFSIAELVADLSDCFTLEPGDIVLTGTPAGASVAHPGQTITVEVDDGTRSSGRLTTTVVEGATVASHVPPLTDAERAQAWGADPHPVTDDALQALLEVGTATLSAALRRRGYDEGVVVEGVHAVTPGTRAVGRARTLRLVAHRHDLFEQRGGGHNAQKQAFDSLLPGDVLVIEARGERGTGTLGDILALRAQRCGAVAVVTDGGVRDLADVRGVGLPVFGAGGHPSVLGRRHVPWSVDDTITCGGATVQPGDVVVADDDGVLIVPPPLVDDLVAEAHDQQRREVFITEQVARGERLDGLYPIGARWKDDYDQWLSTQ